MQAATRSSVTCFDMKRTDIIRENFAHWHEALTRTQELAICQSRAMAPLLAEVHRVTGGGIATLSESVQDILGTPKGGDPLLSLQGAAERLAFCEAFLTAHPVLAEELMLFPTEDSPRRTAPSHIATMRATIFEHAKAKLSHTLSRTESVYCNSFTALCEMLADGQAALALLPIENTTEGILRRSYDLIEHFELRIACTVEVGAPDGTLTRMALLYHSAPPVLLPADCERMLECRTASTNGRALTELLTVAEACAMSLRRVDTQGGEDGELFQHMIFRAEKDDLRFATYLALFLPRTLITAKYLHFN